MERTTEKEIQKLGGFKKLSKIERKGLEQFFIEWVRETFGFELNRKNLIFKRDSIRLDGQGLEWKENQYIQYISLLKNNIVIASVFDYEEDKFDYYIMKF